jgi:hypothetical protein
MTQPHGTEGVVITVPGGSIRLVTAAPTIVISGPDAATGDTVIRVSAPRMLSYQVLASLEAKYGTDHDTPHFGSSQSYTWRHRRLSLSVSHGGPSYKGFVLVSYEPLQCSQWLKRKRRRWPDF